MKRGGRAVAGYSPKTRRSQPMKPPGFFAGRREDEVFRTGVAAAAGAAGFEGVNVTRRFGEDVLRLMITWRLVSAGRSASGISIRIVEPLSEPEPGNATGAGAGARPSSFGAGAGANGRAPGRPPGISIAPLQVGQGISMPAISKGASMFWEQ